MGVENVDPTPDGIGAAITAAQVKDPDALLKLQQAEDAFKIQMTQLGIDSAEKMAELDNEDRASARSREIAVKDRTPMMLAISVTVGFFGMLAILAFVQTQATAHDILVGMTGSLGSAWLGIIGYYFGSSSGSAAKTEIIAAQAKASQ